MVATRSISVDRQTLATGQSTGSTPVDGAGPGTTLVPQAPRACLRTSSSTHPQRPPLAALGTDINDLIPPGDPRVETEDPEEVDPQRANLSQQIREAYCFNHGTTSGRGISELVRETPCRQASHVGTSVQGKIMNARNTTTTPSNRAGTRQTPSMESLKRESTFNQEPKRTQARGRQ
uniref:Uncharacterized protein n=1 Tax=Cannabis sativa TaxID=3483 RepID=A0A803NMX9_CANSA